MKMIKRNVFLKLICLTIIVNIFSCRNNNDIEQSKEFFENGQLKSEGKIENGKKQGKWTFFNSDGDTLTVVNYRNDSIVVKKAYSKNKVLRKIEYLEKSNKTLTTIYFPSGKIQCKIEGVGEVFDGKGICYYENGVLQSEITYKDGEFQGEFKEYHPNGNIFVIAESYGNGIYEIHDTLGVKILKVLFENNLPVDTLTGEFP